MEIQKIKGLIAATFAPFAPSGELNLDVLPEYAKALRKNGIKGVFINGTTGEGAALTAEEKTALIHAWAPYNQEDFKVMAMVSGTNQKEGVQQAHEAAKSRIYGIALNAPYYFKPSSVEALVDFMEPIALAAPDQRLYFYHIPLLSQVSFPMLQLLEEAGKRIPNFAGIKYTHNDLMEFNLCRRHQGGKFDILWGWDETMLAGLSMGAQGAVGSTYNYAAPLYRGLLEAFEQNDMEKALQLQEKSIDLISLFGKYGGAAAGKAIMKLCGLDCGQFRAPVRQLEKADYQALEEELNAMGFFEHSIRDVSLI